VPKPFTVEASIPGSLAIGRHRGTHGRLRLVLPRGSSLGAIIHIPGAWARRRFVARLTALEALILLRRAEGALHRAMARRVALEAVLCVTQQWSI